MLKNEDIARIREEGGDEAVKAAIRDDIKARDEDKKQKARRENKGFTQVYAQGWQRLQSLIKDDAKAARVYAFLAENMGPDGTLCASRSTIALALDVTERTITRHIRKLEDLGAVIVLKMGTSNVYCLNPAEVWKSFDNAKPYAAFNTRALVSKAENPFVKRRLAVLLDGQAPDQRSLFDEAVEGHGIDFSELADGEVEEHGIDINGLAAE